LKVKIGELNLRAELLFINIFCVFLGTKKGDAVQQTSYFTQTIMQAYLYLTIVSEKMLMSDEGYNQRQTQCGYNSSHGHLDQMGQKVRLSISQLFAIYKNMATII
jgi:hypothetical protein